MSRGSPWLIEVAHGERGVLQNEWLITVVAVAQQNGFAARSEQAQIAPRIHRARSAAARSQGRDRAVDRVAFRDPAEIEHERRAAHAPRLRFRRRTREPEIAQAPGS